MSENHDTLRPVWHGGPLQPGERRPTREEAIDAAGRTLAASDIACAQMTPREQAEAAWTPTSPFSVDELEDQIRADRGMTPIHRASTPKGGVRPKSVDEDGT